MNNDVKKIDWSKWDSTEECFSRYSNVKSDLIYGRLSIEQPDLSIMIPTYRRTDLLKEAIDSALNQKTEYTYTISVVDNDCEIDPATDMLMSQYCAEHSNILYFRNEQNIGMFGNWNRCIELAQAEWLCILHDDDLLYNNYIETMYPLAKNSSCGLIGSYRSILDQRDDQYLCMSETGKDAFVSLLLKLFISVRRGRGIPLTNIDAAHSMFFPANIYLLKRSEAIRVGGYDDSFAPFADQAFHEKIIKYCGAEFVPLFLFAYRIAQNESLKEITLWNALFQHASLARVISEDLHMSEKACTRNFREGIVIVYNNFISIKQTLNFSDICANFEIPFRYGNTWIQRWIMLKYNLRWGLLLFRKSKGRGNSK